jgi:hypothetical protein
MPPKIPFSAAARGSVFPRFLVALTLAPDLLLRAKHLFVAAMLAFALVCWLVENLLG